MLGTAMRRLLLFACVALCCRVQGEPPASSEVAPSSAGLLHRPQLRRLENAGAEGDAKAGQESEPDREGTAEEEGEPAGEGAVGEREGEEEGEREAEAEGGKEEGSEGEKAEGEEAEGEGEEEEEESFSPVDIGMAWMLLGSVAFVMILFYLVNFKDDDIRRYSWSIISTTISIFSAVLLFSGVNEFVMTFIPKDATGVILGFTTLLFLSWFVMLQVSIAVISGANCEPEKVDLHSSTWTIADTMRADCGEAVRDEDVRTRTGHRSVAILEGVEVFVVKKKLEREARVCKMKCWATLLAHMTGFAAINMGGALQQTTFFRQNWFTAMLSVFIIMGFLELLFRCTDKLREVASGLDNKRDERDELFDEEVEEAENDIASLAASFLTVQAIRFALSGVLPNAEGLEEPERPHPVSCIMGLIGVALVALMLFLAILLFTLKHHFAHTYNLHRQFDILQNQFAMIFAWCMLWGTRWLAVKYSILSQIGGPGAMAGRISLALGLSSMAFAVIFVLDKIEDLGKSDHTKKKDMVHMQKVIQCIINSLGILVGFSWEQCFDGGVAAVASLTEKPVSVKLMLGIIVAMVIIPAWRRYILSKVIYLETLHREVLKAGSHEHGLDGHGHAPSPEQHGGHSGRSDHSGHQELLDRAEETTGSMYRGAEPQETDQMLAAEPRHAAGTERRT